MMKRFVLMKKVFFIFLIVGFAVTGFAKTEAAPEVYTMRFSSSFNPGATEMVGTIEWCKYIEANSGGRIKVQFFDSGSLYAADKALEAVMMGMCEGIETTSMELTVIMPEWNLVLAPGLMNTPELYSYIVDGEPGVKLWENLERNGLKGIAMVPTAKYGKYGGGYATKDRFIKVPADFDGLKLRVYSPSDVSIVNKYGGVPVSMPGGDVFMALQLGTISGTSCGLGHFSERKFQEAGAIYYTSCPTKGGNPYVTLLNKDWFDKLPADLQILLLESGKRIIDVGSRERAVENDKLDYQYAVDRGVLIYELTPEDIAAWKVDIDLAIETLKASDPGLKELIEMVEEFKKTQG